jgi:hypothetical protein
MTDDTSRTGDRDGRSRRAGPVTTGMLTAGMLTVATVIGLLAGGCSGGSPGTGVASVGAATNKAAPKAGSAESAQDAALAYSRCMRSHGVPKFPDPSSGGGIGIREGDGVDPGSPQFKAADQTCASLRPGANLSPAMQGKMRAANLKYAQCVRSHGIADYPDPKANGGIQIQITPGSDLNPSSPAFQAADRACKHLQIQPPGGGRSLSGGLHGPGPGGGS